MSVWYHPVRTRSTAGYIHVPPSTLMTEMGALMFNVYYNVCLSLIPGRVQGRQAACADLLL